MWKTSIRKYISDYILIIIGTFLMAYSTALFLLPNQLSTGGFSGIATIAYYFLHLNIGGVILALNIPLFIIAFFRIGRDFLFKTIIGTILYSVFTNFLNIFNPVTSDSFLACIYGGVLTGIGTAIILKANGSTGGSDLVSYIIRSFNDKFKTGDLIIFIDSIIIIANVICFRQIEIGLYSVIAIFLMGKMIDIIFEGVNFTKVLFIVSDKSEEIAKYITQNVKRGSTGIYSKGMHTGNDKIMLFCVGKRNDILKIKKIANQIDPNCFIVITNARETWGRGFRKISY